MTVPSDSIDHRIREGIKAEIAPMFEALRRFTDRRIAELIASETVAVGTWHRLSATRDVTQRRPRPGSPGGG